VAAYRFTADPLRRFTAFAPGLSALVMMCLTMPLKRLCKKARRRKGGLPPYQKSGKSPVASH
jgi:hypothetical protein